MPGKTSATHSARAAAELQERLGRPVSFSPRKKAVQGSFEKKAAKEAAALLLSENCMGLSKLKADISKKYKIPCLKNSEILRFIPEGEKSLRAMLLKSPTRTLSGVSPIAIMPPPIPCPGRCIYCPQGENAPKSYTGFEPTTMRAIESGYSAKKQVLSRIRQYSSQGHPTDKCHLIVMGGTFLCAPKGFCESFMLQAYNALNGKESKTLNGAILENARSHHKATGVTFETRPDFGLEAHIDRMLLMGGTQVELGVQTLSDAVYRKVLRGHTVSDVARSSAMLRDSGFKIGYHMMPGLFSTPKQDVSHFRKLFLDQRFRPDMLKIYPALVMRGTPLYSLWEKGKFSPYSTEEAAEVIADATRFIPPYVRIPRIQRDIPSPLISAGVKNSNLRQIVDRLLQERGERCRCIRCREIGSVNRAGRAFGKLRLELKRLDYSASGGKEIFLSFEDTEKDLLAGFLRLRIPNRPHRGELAGSSAVRELHVYGQEAAIGERRSGLAQHHGLGAKLLFEAERITFGLGLEKISVLSGPGARGYYKKLGYSLSGPYMQKKLR